MATHTFDPNMIALDIIPILVKYGVRIDAVDIIFEALKRELERQPVTTENQAQPL